MSSSNVEESGLKRYEFNELSVATHSFSNDDSIDGGRFGSVFKGSLRGEDVAIKKLDKLKKPDKFQNLIKSFGTVAHQNLVSIIGYCNDLFDKLLVSEFVSSNSLEFHLYDEERISDLSWSIRMKIAKGCAKGLAYLHQSGSGIIHGDFKAVNIFLDGDFNPKIAEFGLTELDPKYDRKKPPSQNDDVYSFGTVLLELIMGKKVAKKDMKKAKSLSKKINHLSQNDLNSLIDSKLQEKYNASEMKQMIYCIGISTSEPSVARPNMKKIVEILEGKELSSVNSQLVIDSSPCNGLAPKASHEPQQFEYKELALATDSFSEGCSLGGGGFGHVYSATLRVRGNDKRVAIKKLLNNRLGEAEFLNEIKAVGAVRHRNLVSLIGYCNQGADRLLVLEFVRNKSLRFHLRDQKSSLDWSKRLKIALNAAKGLEYLHKYCISKIIHRDIKSDNILLDHNFISKIADFGLARFFPQTDSVTHITTATQRGTYIYADPHSQKISEKSDVYSFGVVLLELITGRNPFDEEGIVEWAKSRMIEGNLIKHNYDAYVDSQFKKKDYKPSEMKTMVYCAAASLYKPPEDRPTMEQIVRVLEGKESPENLWSAQGSPSQPDHQSRRPYQHELVPPPLLRRYTYKELASITESFSGNHFLWGYPDFEVYKGVISESNIKQDVSIKKLRNVVEQGKDEFEKEIEAINNVRHHNILLLIGYCSDESKNRLLVFQSISDKPLKSCLHESGCSADFLWPQRVKVAKGLASALKYMHEDCKPRILHLFVKSDNVFLTEKFEPKLAEFGSAKFFPDSVTHLTDQIMKNSGYMAPEYDPNKKTHFSDKFDVYSFGVILLELITGKQPVGDFDGHSTLVNWAMPLLVSKRIKKEVFVDKKLKEYNTEQMDRMIACASACLRNKPQKRPEMSKILEVLKENSPPETLNVRS